MLGTTSLISETARIQDHLHGALDLLDRRDVSALDPAARLTRLLLRQALVEYSSEGRFPLNHDRAMRGPSFIDAYGTRCAMAHLMELGGAAELVDEVAHTSNFAYVDELAADARFTEWLVAAGLTVEEAARIQPGYDATPINCLCQQLPPSASGPRVTGVVEVTITELNPSGVATGKVETVYGTSPISVGNQIKVSTRAATVVGTRVLVPIALGKDANSEYRELITVEADGKVGSAIRHEADNWVCGEAAPLPATEVANLRLEASEQTCAATLSAKDLCWAKPHSRRESSNPGDCVYGAGIVPDPSDAGSTIDAGQDAGFSSTSSSSSGGASSSSGNNATPTTSSSGAAADDSGCSTSGSASASIGGTAGSIAVLIAVASALMARQKRR